MSINPPTDIVLGVAQAADPARYRQAVEKLAGAAGPAEKLAFDQTMQSVAPRAVPPPPAFDPATALARLQSRHAAAPSASHQPDAYRSFEAMTLTSFIQTMLPSNASALFGTGTAGEIWKSMLAERIGTELAKSGGIGIAAQLASAHPAMAHDAGGADSDLTDAVREG